MALSVDSHSHFCVASSVCSRSLGRETSNNVLHDGEPQGLVISESEKCLESNSRKIITDKLERLSEQDVAVSATGSGK